MRRGTVLLLAFVLVLGILAAGAASVLHDGLSARAQPSALETALAAVMRKLAMPSAAQSAKNPVANSPEVLREGRLHFADHCAICHGNDGSGATELGQNMFPRAPDMRLPDTQNLTDGEIYWVIANGVRLTGMPAWGPGGPDDADTWKLVHFVRRLTDLTPADLKAMKALNPRSPGEYEEERADERFLSGETPEAASPAPHHHD